ncbi:MAG TPA: AraC family transcriptional regulator [Puia sp.]|nr:AraC family transcriptional regulator [Puia sp.]
MQKLPGNLASDEKADLQVFYYDLDNLMNRSKVVLEQYVISFLLGGHKELNFAGSAIQIDNTKALIVTQGNCLLTEKDHGSQDYRSILLFFSRQKLTELLLKRGLLSDPSQKPKPVSPYFSFEQDTFIKVFINSLSLHFSLGKNLSKQLLEVKFEEIMIYLADTYGNRFISFLQYSLEQDHNLSFKNTMEVNKYTNLSLEELAFLCNMSVSTFKRHFGKVFKDTPGNWFKQKRLERARTLLQTGKATPSEIFNSSGYKNLSHFSTAFKNRFGKSPRHSISD